MNIYDSIKNCITSLRNSVALLRRPENQVPALVFINILLSSLTMICLTIFLKNDEEMREEEMRQAQADTGTSFDAPPPNTIQEAIVGAVGVVCDQLPTLLEKAPVKLESTAAIAVTVKLTLRDIAICLCACAKLPQLRLGITKLIAQTPFTCLSEDGGKSYTGPYFPEEGFKGEATGRLATDTLQDIARLFKIDEPRPAQRYPTPAAVYDKQTSRFFWNDAVVHGDPEAKQTPCHCSFAA